MNSKFTTKSDEVYEKLKTRVVSMQIPPGHLILERQLSKEFQVSRTPIREAIIKLMHEGFLIENEGKIFTANLTIEDIKEIFQIREALECKAGELAIDHVDNQFIDELKNINKQLAEHLHEQRYYDFFEADESFHLAIVKRGRNGRMYDILSNYKLQVGRIRHLTILDPDRMTNTISEHENIINAIENKCVSDLQHKIINHIKAVEQTIDRFGDISNLAPFSNMTNNS